MIGSVRCPGKSASTNLIYRSGQAWEICSSTIHVRSHVHRVTLIFASVSLKFDKFIHIDVIKYQDPID